MRILLLSTFLLTTTLLCSQITTDRLGRSNSPLTVSKGSLQLETGISVEQFFSIQDFKLPSIHLRYGITDRLEARVFTAWQALRVGTTINLPAKPLSGLSDIHLGAKYNFGKSRNGKWDFTLESNFIIRRAPGIVSFENDLGGIHSLIVGQQISDRLSIIHSITYQHFDYQSGGIYTYSPQLQAKINKRTSIMFEPAIRVYNFEAGPHYFFNTGMTHQVGKNVLFDLTLGFGTGFDYNNASLGASILFNRE